MPITREQLVDYLESEGVDVESEGVSDSTALFSSNLLDSFKMVSLIMFVEKSCGIRVGASDLTLENFDTLGSILRFADQKEAGV